MKTLQLIVIAIAAVFMIIGTNVVFAEKQLNNAILMPFKDNELVVVGKVITVNRTVSENKTQYSIAVEKYLKNPKSFDLLTATGYGIRKEITDQFQQRYFNQAIFEKGDRVFLYLHQKGGQYVISPFSFLISRSDVIHPPDSATIRPGKNNYYENDDITILGAIDKGYMYTSSAEYGSNSTVSIVVSNPNHEKYLIDQVDVKPDGSFIYQFKIKGKLGITGTYESDINIGSGGYGVTFDYIANPLLQFKSGIALKDVTCRQGLQLIFKFTDGTPACVKPDTATKLELRGWAYQDILSKNKPYEGFTSTNTNQTLIIGTDVYDVREFSPVAGNTIYLDDMKFVYGGRSPLNNSCYPELVNQTQARDFEIVSNETDMHAHYCWPPTNYPQNMTKQNVFPHDLFSRYSIGFFDNQTMGIGWCHLDSCEFGKMFYLVKKGWNTPIVYDSPSNLEFHLATNASVISGGQAIGIDMSTSNKLSNTIMVSNKYDFSFEGTGLGPCYYGPFRLGIFKGYFDENNFTKGTELKMYPPGMYSCAAPSPAKGYKFEPKSETSTPRCSPFEYCAWIEQMQDHVFFYGYWEDTKFHKFESGTYTIIAGDEWRNHSIKHFTVSQNR